MRVILSHNLDDISRQLSGIEREAVRPAAKAAMGNAIRYTEVRTVRWVRKRLSEKGLKLRNKDIRDKNIVYMIKPGFQKGRYSASVGGGIYEAITGVVYINKFGSRMSTSRGFTEADANSINAKPEKGQQVKGRAFKFIGRTSGSEMWGKRHPTIRYDDRFPGHKNAWRSSKAIALYYRAKIEGSDKATRVLGKLGERQFYKRFNYHLQRRIDRIWRRQ
jgi:hypothetical protein